MNRKYLPLFLTFTLLAVSFSLQARADGIVTIRERTRNLGAYAFWYLQDSADTCRFHAIGINVVEGVKKKDPKNLSNASVNISTYNACTQEVEKDFYGSVDLVPDAFIINGGLWEASLFAIIPVYDYYSGAEMQITVNMYWTSDGELRIGRSNSVYKSDGLMIQSFFNGKWRTGTAEGTVFDGSVNLVPGPTDNAELSDTISGYIEVRK